MNKIEFLTFKQASKVFYNEYWITLYKTVRPQNFYIVPQDSIRYSRSLIDFWYKYERGTRQLESANRHDIGCPSILLRMQCTIQTKD